MADSIHVLLPSFFKLCQEHFQFLEKDNNFIRIEGLSNYAQGRKFITPYIVKQGLPDDLRKIWAVSRFERDDLTIEIGYGDADFRLSAHLYYGPIFRTTLHDLLNANDVATDSSFHQWVNDEAVLENCIKNIANTIQFHKRFVFKMDDQIIEKIQLKRSRKVRESIKAQHQDILKSLTLMSAKALQNKDYRRVIELLRPYKKYLSETDLNKLQHAQSLILQDGA